MDRFTFDSLVVVVVDSMVDIYRFTQTVAIHIRNTLELLKYLYVSALLCTHIYILVTVYSPFPP